MIGEETSDRDVVPSLTLPVSVPDDEGATLPIDVGVLGRARVSGSLGDSSDDLDVEGAVIRAVSTTLSGSAGSLTIETTSVNGGDFTLDLLPGSYTVSVIPDYDPHPRSSPISIGVEVAADDELDLGRVALPGLGTLAGVVVDQEGDPVGGAQVKATQTGYGHHAYNATTDQDGSYRLEIPVTPYEVTVTPVGTGGAVTRRNLTPGQNGNITLDVGLAVTGTVTWQGAPVAFALVEVRDLRSGALLGSTSSDNSGAFALEVVVPTASPEPTGTTDTEPTDTGPGDTGDTGDTANR